MWYGFIELENDDTSYCTIVLTETWSWEIKNKCTVNFEFYVVSQPLDILIAIAQYAWSSQCHMNFSDPWTSSEIVSDLLS